MLVASPVVTSISGYYFGREWEDGGIIFSILIAPVTFFLWLELTVNLSGGYQGTGGGAAALFLGVPAFIFILSLVFSVIGAYRKQAADKRLASGTSR